MPENLANDFQTTLAAAITSTSATSISVVTAAPVAAPFRIRIDSEYMLVTAGGTTTTWTVERGVEGSTAATHTNNTPVAMVMTAETFRQLQQERLWFGA
jgi:hypothetical protein